MKTKKLKDVIANHYLIGVGGTILFLLNYLANYDKLDLIYVWVLFAIFGGIFLYGMIPAIYLTAVRLRKIDSKPYRRTIYQYFRWNDWNYETTITKIEVEQTLKGVMIYIETHRPGLLIGKGGKFINGLLTHLKEEMADSNIEIDLKECKLHHFIAKSLG